MGNITIDSAETIAALEYVKMLYEQAMDPRVADTEMWTASSNNATLRDGEASLVNNPISAYRSVQSNLPDVYDDIFLTSAIMGPSGAFTPPCCTYTYVVPNHSRNANAAQDFIKNLVENYGDAVFNAGLYNLASFPQTAPMQSGWLDDDPLTSSPADKLSVLADFGAATVQLGYPGPSNPAVGEAWDTNVLTRMFRSVATGDQMPDEAISAAQADLEEIFERWRETGLV